MHRQQPVQEHAAEDPLVDEAQLAASVREGLPRIQEIEAQPQVPGGRGVGPSQQGLPAHAQVHHQGIVQAVPPRIREQQPQVFPAPGDVVDPRATEPGAEIPRSGVVAAQGPGVQDLDVGDAGAEHVRGQSGAHHLDLGQLRHLRRR